MIGEHVQKAHADLAALVERVAAGGMTEEEARGAMRSWALTSAQDSSRLSQAAISTLEYELAAEGLSRGEDTGGEMGRKLAALQALKRALALPEGSGDPGDGEARPVRVSVPPALRARLPHAQGFRMGPIEIIADPADPTGGWHVSVKHPERFPTRGELYRAAAVAGEGRIFWDWMPPEGASPAAPGPGGFVVHLFERPPAGGRA